MNKPIPLYKRKWRGMPRVHIVVQHDNEPTQWIPLSEVACWYLTGCIVLLTALLFFGVI